MHLKQRHTCGAIGAFVLFRKNFTVQPVSSEVTWLALSTFTSFYRMNVTHRASDTFSVERWLVISFQVI